MYLRISGNLGCVYTGPAKRPQIRSLRRANIRPPRKASFLKLGRPNSRAASCKRLWPAKYLHGTKKRVSMRATVENTEWEIEILGPKLMYCCWLESLVGFCVCSLCFAENMNDFRRKTLFSNQTIFQSLIAVMSAIFLKHNFVKRAHENRELEKLFS